MTDTKNTLIADAEQFIVGAALLNCQSMCLNVMIVVGDYQTEEKQNEQVEWYAD